MEVKYNKLVRDRIPDIIEADGKKANIEFMDEEEHLELLNKKLYEELEEYMEDGSVEELADLTEVIHGILDLKGISLEEFEDIRREKELKRGGFKKGIKLISVIE